MKKLIKFFNYDEDEGKIRLCPPFMGSDVWSLRSADDYSLVYGVDDFLDQGYVLLGDGKYLLNLIELDDYTCFSMKFVVKGRQVIIEEVTCRNHYKRHYFSIMPDRGIYTL